MAACGMSRLLGGTLERVCKAVLLLCLLHFLVAVILYFDVYAQHLAFFSRFSARGPARALHPAASSSTNCSRPNATAPSSGLPEAPSARPGPTAPVLPPCPDSPPGLGETAGWGLPLGVGRGLGEWSLDPRGCQGSGCVVRGLFLGFPCPPQAEGEGWCPWVLMKA